MPTPQTMPTNALGKSLLLLLLLHVCPILCFLSPLCDRGSIVGHWHEDGPRRHFLAASSTVDAQEETLMQVHLSILPNVSPEEAMDVLQSYSRSFPFAAVLPVQPLMYLPTDDGVEVRFLRKKTEEKSGVDGGILFSVEEDDDDCSLQVIATRNSKGQTLQKLFAEKLIITNFVAGLTSSQPEYKAKVSPLDVVEVASIYHKWMQV